MSRERGTPPFSQRLEELQRGQHAILAQPPTLQLDSVSSRADSLLEKAKELGAQHVPLRTEPHQDAYENTRDSGNSTMTVAAVRDAERAWRATFTDITKEQWANCGYITAPTPRPRMLDPSRSRMVEFVLLPVFDEITPCPLPSAEHSPQKLLSMAAQSGPCDYPSHFRRSMLRSEFSNIFLDAFWWIWIQCFGELDYFGAYLSDIDPLHRWYFCVLRLSGRSTHLRK
eukprot:m.570669 g.570669  ORF g.570669 m.570669 type:complete len:228 (+) comp22263_c3_seq47:291-974(+)